MCQMQVQVVEVEDSELDAPWAAGRTTDGERVVFVRRSATPAQAIEGYAAALRQCPIRMALEATRQSAA